MPLIDLLDQLGGLDASTLRRLPERTVQALIEAGAAAMVGADRHKWIAERLTLRNGHRPRNWDA